MKKLSSIALALLLTAGAAQADEAAFDKCMADTLAAFGINTALGNLLSLPGNIDARAECFSLLSQDDPKYKQAMEDREFFAQIQRFAVRHRFINI